MVVPTSVLWLLGGFYALFLPQSVVLSRSVLGTRGVVTTSLSAVVIAAVWFTILGAVGIGVSEVVLYMYGI